MEESTSPRILIVDDDPETTDIICRVLSKEGFDVTTTVDPRQAIEYVEDEKFAVVVSDIQMPEISGHELTRAVHDTVKGTQVILMTAYSTIDKVVEAYQVGASDYLLKPFEDLDEVAEAVRGAVRRHQRWHEALRKTYRQSEQRWA